MIRYATLALILAASACSGTARGLEAYRTDTQTLLDTKSQQLQQCYDAALKTNNALAGTVTIQFVVEKKTGVISHATVDTAHSTAPAPLGDCVVKAVDGLALDPADRDEGRATFVYEFKPPAAKPAA
jgi:hypothetical protein